MSLTPAKSRRRKIQIAQRDGGWTCRYCGKALDPIVNPDQSPPIKPTRTTPTIDHVIPRSQGGSNHLRNLVLACVPCNSTKGSREGLTAHKPTPLKKHRHRESGAYFDDWIAMYVCKRKPC